MDPRGKQFPTERAARRTPHNQTVSGLYSEQRRDYTFLATVNELSSVHPLSGDKRLLAKLVAVWVSEDHPGQRSSTPRVMNDVLNHTL